MKNYDNTPTLKLNEAKELSLAKAPKPAPRNSLSAQDKPIITNNNIYNDLASLEVIIIELSYRFPNCYHRLFFF